MEETIKTILLFISGFAVWYLGIAFIGLESNVFEWDEKTRALFIVESTLTSLLFYATYKILED